MAVEERPLLPWEDDHDHGRRAFVPTRRRQRFSRADVACLLVLVLGVSFIAFSRPTLRLENPILLQRAEVEGGSFQFMTYADVSAHGRKHGYNVSVSPRGFTVDGKQTLLLGGSIHYPRSTPVMWDDLLLKAKHDGLNHIELYVFWNFHEIERGVFNFAERGNLTHFYELAARHGLFLNVRFGPYVCAEWNNGGLPVWLNWMPGMSVRSTNAPWQAEMERFVRYMVDLSRPYLAKHGGPIIMAQIENEYWDDDDAYVEWCGHLVEELDTSIPWVMCNGKSANNTILACNGNDCVGFARNQTRDHPLQPFVWTENEGWYQKWADDQEHLDPYQDDHRTPADVAYTVARWFAVGGASHNYYMYHGGNNYGRTASAGVTTMYADDVSLHSDGLGNEPKRSHLRLLHQVLRECNDELLSTERQLLHPVPIGYSEDGKVTQRAFEYGNNSSRVVFLENLGSSFAKVEYEGQTYSLPSKSMVILRGGEIRFNTSALYKSFPFTYERTYVDVSPASKMSWRSWSEMANFDQTSRRKRVAKHPVEQLRVTNDKTDVLIYETTLNMSSFAEPVIDGHSISFTSCDANAFLVFVDNQFAGDTFLAFPGGNCSRSYRVSTSLLDTTRESVNLKLVSISLGIYSLDRNHSKGLTGEVLLDGVHSLIHDKSKWTMYPGLLGEDLAITTHEWHESVDWDADPASVTRQLPLTWYSTTFQFDPSVIAVDKNGEVVASILLDCQGLSRGRAFVNGHDLGRFWLIENADGQPIQRYYHIPTDWLYASRPNLLVLMDELGGSVEHVRVVSSSFVSTRIEGTTSSESSTIMLPPDSAVLTSE
ncbi:TPA: hypothetical protein N0F65_003434 [Lagenidium giganteum]|uniref:Beta-galactosidase n=1 Tax=Lagenidium giganteum TaxID=4803 RepID=A0AAV2YKE9_9STRA|nr:TPA: hypothetical protein N0F65_003434 [Lagenidium giganteum]